jgi:hypothetical protein
MRVGIISAMAIAQLLLDYIRVLAWPTVVLAVFWRLRKVVAATIEEQLPGLLGRMSQGEINVAGLRMMVQLSEVNEQLSSESAEVPEPVKIEIESSVRTSFEGSAAMDNPIPGRLSEPAWDVARSFVTLIGLVERAARNLGFSCTTEEANRPGSGGSYGLARRFLADKGVIGPKLWDSLKRVEGVYSSAINTPEMVSAKDADKFRETVTRLGERIIGQARDTQFHEGRSQS